MGRTKDPVQLEAWRAMLLADSSEALLGLEQKEREQIRAGFEIQEASIFEGCATPASTDAERDIEIGARAVVSPANSFGDMTGGSDFLYLQRFGQDVQKGLQDRI